MKKIILIDPEGICHGLNTGLAYLNSSLKFHGIEAAVIDFNNNHRQCRERLAIVKEVELVGISIKTDTAIESVRLAQKIKDLNPKAFIIGGGPHIAVDGDEFISRYKVFDIGLAGEGEYSFPQIVMDGDISNINGVIYRNGDNVVANRLNEFIKDLDKLPFPDYGDFDLDTHRHRFLLTSYPLLTSRGCPYNCIFCSSYLVMDKRWRGRSPENVIEELKMARKGLATEFQIQDDNFTYNLARAKEICRGIIAEKIDLRWSCPGGLRADRIDPELASLMKKAGCYSVQLGIETGVEKIFDGINKGEKLNDIIRAVSILKREGIRVIGFFIIGLPGSSFNLDKASVDFAESLGLDLAVWSMAQPYKGTELFNIINRDRGIKIVKDWKEAVSFGPNTTPAFETEDYLTKDRLRMYYYANLKSRAYVAFVKQNGPFWVKALQVLKVILRYDLINFLPHLINNVKIIIRKNKRYYW